MEQTKALNALEPFLALTKSATSPRAAADLVTRATSASGTYVFAELLRAPQVQALTQSPEHASYYTLLEIFSYGTYSTYKSTANLPALNEQQTLKLRQLSLLTLAKDPHNLSYARLQSSLGLANARAVEDLAISAIYAGLVSAQLDPRNQAVLISSVSPLRDLAPNSIPSMLSSLHTWSERCTSTLSDLDAQITAIKAGAAERHSEKKAWDERTQALLELNSASERFGAAPGASSVHGHGQTNLISRAVSSLQQSKRYGKRERGQGSSLDAPGGLLDQELMDVDDDDDENDPEESGEGSGLAGAKKRANRRKL